MEQFEWKPGVGIDSFALGRLRKHFPKPRKSMGEAWFMGERKIYDELHGDLSTLPLYMLQSPLAEIAGGICSFGPLPEWDEWYHYLLAQLLPRSHEFYSLGSLVECLVTGFMALYPYGAEHGPYPQFLDDVLLTLGQCMMERNVWKGDNIVLGAILHRSNDYPDGIWRWWDASGDLSASMFFCLKYLPERCVGAWLRSVFAISSPHWRAQIIAWLIGAHDLLSGQLLRPSDFPERARPSIAWEPSYCIRPHLTGAPSVEANAPAQFLPDSSRVLALQLTRDYFTEDVFLSWLETIASEPYLLDELAEIPSTFETLYVRPDSFKL